MEYTEVLLCDRTIAGESFARQKLDQFTAVNCVFDKCDFSGMAVKQFVFGAGKQLSTYVDCVFDGARLACTGADVAALRSCSFREVRINNWECRTVDLVDCTFTGTLRKCVFDGIPIPHLAEQRNKAMNHITGNDFSGCQLINVDFNVGVDLKLQRLPAGPDYLWIADLAAAIPMMSEPAAMAQWGQADPTDAEALVSFLTRLEAEGHDSFFARIADWRKIFGAVLDDAAAHLRGGGIDRNAT